MPIARMSFRKVISVYTLTYCLLAFPWVLTKVLLTIISLPPALPQKNPNKQKCCHSADTKRQTHEPRSPFMAALFILSPNWSNLTVISSRLYKLWYNHKMECYLAIKKECITDVCNNVGESHGYKVEQKKTDMKAYTV